MFGIFINGTPRTFRDREDIALDAGRVLHARGNAQITVVNTATGQWVTIDPRVAVVWKDAPALSVVRQTA
jgi:hypothetical protein